MSFCSVLIVSVPFIFSSRKKEESASGGRRKKVVKPKSEEEKEVAPDSTRYKPGKIFVLSSCT